MEIFPRKTQILSNAFLSTLSRGIKLSELKKILVLSCFHYSNDISESCSGELNPNGAENLLFQQKIVDSSDLIFFDTLSVLSMFTKCQGKFNEHKFMPNNKIITIHFVIEKGKKIEKKKNNKVVFPSQFFLARSKSIIVFIVKKFRTTYFMLTHFYNVLFNTFYVLKKLVSCLSIILKICLH